MRQIEVAKDIAGQIAAGQQGIAGVMLESHLVSGRQDYSSDSNNVYGQSITDACIDVATTAAILSDLAQAVKKRRKSQ